MISVSKFTRKRNASVLVLNRVELISIIVAGTAQWFGFRRKITPITQPWFICCRAVLTPGQALFSPSHHPAREGTGAGQDPAWTEGHSIPHSITLRNKTEQSWLGSCCCLSCLSLKPWVFTFFLPRSCPSHWEAGQVNGCVVLSRLSG